MASIDEYIEKVEPVDTTGGNVKQFNCCECWMALQKYCTELSYDPAIPLLGIPKRNANRYSNKYMYMNVYSSPVHKSFILGVSLPTCWVCSFFISKM